MGSPGSTPDVSATDVRSVVAARDGPLTTEEVADELDASVETVRRILERLEADEALSTREPGGQRIWWTGGGTDAGTDQQSELGEFGAFVRDVEDYAIFVLEPDGTVASWNEGAARIKGYAAEEIIGEHVSTFYTDEDVADGVPERNLELAAERGRVEDEGWRVRADGSRFWANVVVTAVRDDDGSLQGFTKVTRDMTGRRELEQRLRQERDQTEQLLRTVPVAIAVQNADRETVRANRRAQEVFGISEREFRENPVDDGEWEVCDREGNPIPPDETPSARVIEREEPVFDEVVMERPDGERMHFTVNAAPIVGPDGDVERVVTAGQEITDLRARERQLERRKTALETELSEIFDRVSDAFYALDDEYRFTHVNERAAELLGRPADELLGRTIWEVLPDGVDEVYRDDFETAMESQEPVTFERYVGPEDVWLEFNVYPSDSGLSIYFRDVTDRKERERELERTERRFEAIFEDPNILVGLLDPDGTVLDVNETAMEYVDADLDDVVGEPFWETPWWGRGDDVAADVKAWTERAAAGEYVDFEADLTRPDGQRYVLDGVFRPVTDDDGEVVSVVVSDRDVTERREYERELEESERRYRTLVDNFPNGAVALVDESIRYQTVGGRPTDVADATAEELEGKPVRDVVPAPLSDELVSRYEAAFAGESSEFEHDVGDRTFQFQVVPVRDATGDVFAALGMSQDVTDQKERERELTKYETIVETVDDGIYVKDDDGYFTMVNDAYAELTGYDPEELVGAHASLVVDETAIEQAREMELGNERGDTADGQAVEATLKTADGREVPTEGTFATFQTDDGNRKRVGVVRDITERKEQRRRIEESERRYRTLVDNFPNGAVGLFDENLRYTAVGGQFLDEIGLETADRVGNSVSDVYPDELVEQVEPYFRAALDGEASAFEVEHHGRQLFAHTLPVSNGDDEVFAGMLVVRDVTERREYERKLEESNERLEQFAYAASHDLQEPLRMVSSYLTLVEQRYADELDDDGREFIEYAVDGADRMRDMIEGLLEYSRVETQGDAFGPVDLDAVLADVRSDLQVRFAESGAEVTADELPTVQGDAGQLRQVFQNLLDNAVEYSGDDPPRIHVGARRRGVLASGASEGSSDERIESDGEWWELSVSDEGIGIDPDDADRVFEVFQSLHSRTDHGGTGIGLALCERIVERHGGDIWVDSEPGEGATFTFTLPATNPDEE